MTDYKQGLGSIGVLKKINEHIKPYETKEFTAAEVNAIVSINPRNVRANLARLEKDGIISKETSYPDGFGSKKTVYKLNLQGLINMLLNEE